MKHVYTVILCTHTHTHTQLKLLFDEIVSLVRHLKQLGWNEQTLTFKEGNGRLINGVELLRYVAAVLSNSAGIMKDGGMENQRIMSSSQNEIVTPFPPNSTSRPLSSTNRCMNLLRVYYID